MHERPLQRIMLKKWGVPHAIEGLQAPLFVSESSCFLLIPLRSHLTRRDAGTNNGGS